MYTSFEHNVFEILFSPAADGTRTRKATFAAQNPARAPRMPLPPLLSFGY